MLGQAQNGALQTGRAADSPPFVESIGVSPQPQGLAIEIALSAPYVPQAVQLTNPDRSVFDFPGYQLRGGNLRIVVNRGPVQRVRASLFQVHPPVARIVVDSKETLKFAVEPAGNKIVVEITFAPGVNSPLAAKASDSPREDARAIASPRDVENPPIAAAGAASRPTACSLQGRVKALRQEELQTLENKAAAGDPEAQTTLALAYHDPVLLKNNDSEALRLLHQAADHGFMAAEELLGIFLERGLGVGQPSPLEAIDWYEKAVEQGSQDAATNIALMYEDGIGIPKDSSQALTWFGRTAEGGAPAAHYSLVLVYQRCNGLLQNPKEYVRWLTAPAEQGVVPALLDLGAYSLHPPDGVKPDLDRALHSYQKAGELGSAPAQAIMGDIYASGLLGKPDFGEALKWYRKGAEQGQSDAQYGLGMLYARGEGVPVDQEQARRLLGLAADQGLGEAQLYLGILLEEGVGGPADTAKATHYYQLAAEQGLPAAQFRLGALLGRNKESVSDRIAAYKWLMLAEPSIRKSSTTLNDLRKSMSAEDVTAADRQADEWRKAHPQKPQ
jgi:TPR repeat protein